MLLRVFWLIYVLIKIASHIATKGRWFVHG